MRVHMPMVVIMVVVVMGVVISKCIWSVLTVNWAKFT